MTSPGTVRTPWRQRLADLGRGPLSLCVWLGLTVLSGWLLLRRAAQVELVGLARAIEYEVSSPLPLALHSLAVELYQVVEPGQELAVLDSADLDARLDTSRAVVAQLRAELEGARAAVDLERHALAEERLTELRRFAQDEQELELRRFELEIDLAAERVEEQRLALDLARVRRLEEQGIAATGEFDAVRLAHEEVVERIRRTEELAGSVAQALSSTRDRQSGFVALGPPPASLPDERAFLERIRVEEFRVREVEVEQRARVLRAPVRGIVQRILAAPGQAIGRGEPVLVLVSALPEEIVAYLPEAHDLAVRPGAKAFVALARPPWTVSEALIVQVGPAIEPLPARLWRDPASPEFGLPVIAKSGPSSLLLPGERVHLRLAR